MRVNVFVSVRNIDTIAFFLVGDDCRQAFEDDDVIAVARVHDNLRLSCEIFGLLHHAIRDEVDACAIPNKPHGHRMWPPIRSGGADPDRAQGSQRQIDLLPGNKARHCGFLSFIMFFKPYKAYQTFLPSFVEIQLLFRLQEHKMTLWAITLFYFNEDIARFFRFGG